MHIVCVPDTIRLLASGFHGNQHQQANHQRRGISFSPIVTHRSFLIPFMFIVLRKPMLQSNRNTSN